MIFLSSSVRWPRSGIGGRDGRLFADIVCSQCLLARPSVRWTDPTGPSPPIDSDEESGSEFPVRAYDEVRSRRRIVVRLILRRRRYPTKNKNRDISDYPDDDLRRSVTEEAAAALTRPSRTYTSMTRRRRLSRRAPLAPAFYA